MIKPFLKGLAALAMIASAQSASAIVNAPVSANAYITIGGLQWAWASPCGAVDSCGDIDLSYQATQGWRLPTAAEFANHPTAEQFVFVGANVPAFGSDSFGNMFQAGSPGADAACAAAFFSPYTHCDWSDGLAGQWYDPSIAGGQGVPETLLVRTAVPEPASWALLITGFALVGAAARRRSTALTA